MRPRLTKALRWFILSVGVFLCGSASSVRAEPEPAATLPSRLTLDDALALFRARGLDLLLADAAVDDARADERSSGAVPNPAVNLGVGKSFGYDQTTCRGCSALLWSAGVSDQAALIDSLSGKRGLRLDVARAGVRAAQMSRVDALRVVGGAVKQQYLQAALARASLDFVREAKETTTHTSELVEARYHAGAVSEADVARVQTAALQADQAVDSAAQALRIAKVQIAFLLGIRGPVPEFNVDPDMIRYTVPQALVSVSPESLLKVAFEHRADLKGLDYQREQARAAIDLAKRQRVPDIALSMQYTQQGSGQDLVSPPTLTFGVSTPLPLFYQQAGQIDKANAALRTQTLGRSKLEAQVVSEVEGALTAFVGSKSRIERMESALLSRAQRARDLVAIQYQKGAASLLELLDAQRTFIATNIDYRQELTDYWAAIFQLEQAVGMDLR